MLKNIDPRMSPELLYVLAQMGHGDRLAIVDRNYPVVSTAQRVVRLDALNLTEALDVVLSVFPVDNFVEQPVAGMNNVDDPEAIPEVQQQAFAAVNVAEGRTVGVQRLPRFDFYQQAASCFAVLATSEARPYGCIMVTKGVIF